MTRRTDIMRRELRRTVLEAAPGLTDCIWEPYDGPRPSRPYASWRPISQTSSGMRLLDDTQTLELPRQAIVKVLAATPGETYRLKWNYTQTSHVAPAGATVTSVRDALLSGINSDREPVTASAVGADEILVEGDEAGSLWRLRAYGAELEADEAPGSPVDAVNLMRAPLNLTASLNVFSAGYSSAGGDMAEESSSYAHKIDIAFRKPRVTESLASWDLSVVRIAEPVNLDGLPPSQTSFESRTATDYRIELPYWDAEPAEVIESVEVDIVTDKGSTSFPV